MVEADTTIGRLDPGPVELCCFPRSWFIGATSLDGWICETDDAVYSEQLHFIASRLCLIQTVRLDIISKTVRIDIFKNINNIE